MDASSLLLLLRWRYCAVLAPPFRPLLASLPPASILSTRTANALSSAGVVRPVHGCVAHLLLCRRRLLLVLLTRRTRQALCLRRPARRAAIPPPPNSVPAACDAAHNRSTMSGAQNAQLPQAEERRKQAHNKALFLLLFWRRCLRSRAAALTAGQNGM